jgi:hypothetical protein
MRTCRFCTKEIHDAATACKHCGRTLLPMPAAAPRKVEIIWGPVLLVGGVLFAAFAGTLYFSKDHQLYRQFDARRTTWHRQCDVYVGRATGANPDARACAEDLSAIMAFAKQQGW